MYTNVEKWNICWSLHDGGRLYIYIEFQRSTHYTLWEKHPFKRFLFVFPVYFNLLSFFVFILVAYKLRVCCVLHIFTQIMLQRGTKYRYFTEMCTCFYIYLEQPINKTRRVFLIKFCLTWIKLWLFSSRVGKIEDLEIKGLTVS